MRRKGEHHLQVVELHQNTRKVWALLVVVRVPRCGVIAEWRQLAWEATLQLTSLPVDQSGDCDVPAKEPQESLGKRMPGSAPNGSQRQSVIVWSRCVILAGTSPSSPRMVFGSGRVLTGMRPSPRGRQRRQPPALRGACPARLSEPWGSRMWNRSTTPLTVDELGLFG